MARLRSLVTNASLLAASLLLLLVCLELYLLLWSPQRADSGGMFVAHPELGWTFAPGRRGEIVYPGEAAHSIHTNDHGFRDDPFDPKDASAHRIVVLGDSFVSNISVEKEAVFTEVLEQSLPGATVMNLGVNGYGQVQELLLLERVLDELSPDLVLVNVYLRNDLDDNRGRWWSPRLSRPTAVIAPGGGVTIEPPRRRRGVRDAPGPAQKSLFDGLHSYHFLRARLAFLTARLRPTSARAPKATPGPEASARAARRRSRFEAPELTLCAVEPDAETERLYRTTELLLLDLASRARDAGVPLALSFAPSMVQVIPELWQKLSDQASEQGLRLDRELPNRRLQRFAFRHGIPALDLLPPLREAQMRGESTYNRVEQHWTAAGNRVVAEALHGFLLADARCRSALGLGEAESGPDSGQRPQ